MSEGFDWQSWAALGIVITTVLTFGIRAMRSKKQGCSSCSSHKGC